MVKQKEIKIKYPEARVRAINSMGHSYPFRQRQTGTNGL